MSDLQHYVVLRLTVLDDDSNRGDPINADVFIAVLDWSSENPSSLEQRHILTSERCAAQY